MANHGTFYVGRILKRGNLDQKNLIDALKKPAIVPSRSHSWTFIDVEEHKENGHHYVYGKLSKFSPEGEVTIVDTVSHSEKTQKEKNLRMASSPFIYIPEHSGIAFLHVYNHIEQNTFIRRFCDIIEATHGHFFVGCSIELVADLKSFAAKLVSLDSILHISAGISPPNPLFSPLWASLEKYLRDRQADKMTIIEDASKSQGLQTQLPEIVKQASIQTEEQRFVPDHEIQIGDAAVLMAADGYGKGKIKGKKGKETIVIRTSETAVNFSFVKEPDVHELYLRVHEIFKAIRKQRHMEHGE